MTLNLHGVVRAGHPLPDPAQFDVRLVVWEDLAVVVSALHRDRDVAEQDAAQQLGMLSEMVQRGPVVPLRWGTVAEDDESARTEVIRPVAPHLRSELERLDGLVEFHVYLQFDEETAMQAVAGERGGWGGRPAAALTDRVKAGEAIARRVVAWRRARSDDLLKPLNRYAQDVETLEDGDHLVERRAFLVRQENVPAASRAVAAIAAEDVDSRLVAPLPAFSFLRDVSKTSDDRDRASRWGW
jgi:hypothetical protein